MKFISRPTSLGLASIFIPNKRSQAHRHVNGLAALITRLCHTAILSACVGDKDVDSIFLVYLEIYESDPRN